MRSLAMSIGRCNEKSIVNQVMKNDCMRRIVAVKVGDVLCKELKDTCKAKNGSVYSDKSIEAIENFNWSTLATDLERTAPMLSTILGKCATSKANSANSDITVAVIAGILLRNCSQRANLLQRLFAVLLYASHAPKQVSSSLTIQFYSLFYLYSFLSDYKKLVCV